jgi:hypothetical protein
MARMPARIGSARVGQASMISAKSGGGSGSERVADWVAVWGRVETECVGSRREPD